MAADSQSELPGDGWGSPLMHRAADLRVLLCAVRTSGPRLIDDFGPCHECRLVLREPQ
jgi:hypothetical protein